MAGFTLTVVALIFLPFCWSDIISTKYGDVEGNTITLLDDFHYGTQVNTYLGVPYAKPPLGPDRFKNPVEPEPWEGVRPALNNPPMCIQQSSSDIQDEDCLYLNIFSPTDRSDEPYAVYLHIYGGGFNSGANWAYPGHFLAAHGIISVVPNYRLNVFGFAYSGDDAAPGNMGLRDVVQSLRFVQDNIANFGGDPDRVTIYGMSAGGSAAGDLILSPEADGLFHQAGLMSGVELALWAYFGEAYDSLYHLQQVAEHCECPTDDNQEMVDCLRLVPAEELYTKGWFNCSLVDHLCGTWRPVVDGPGGFLPESPWVMREKKQFKPVPEFVGFTDHDGFYGMYGWGEMSREDFEKRMLDFGTVYSAVYTEEGREEDVSAAYNFAYSPWPHIYDGYANRDAYGMFLTDAWYGTVADEQAKSHAQEAPVYFYVFDYVSDEHVLIPDWIGTTHGMDFYYIFGEPFRNSTPAIQEQFIFNNVSYNDNDREYSYYMLELQANFVKYGDPSPSAIQTPPFMGLDDMKWDEFGNENLSYIYFGQDYVANQHHHRQHEYAFFQKYIYYLAYGDEGRPEDF